MMYCPNMYHDSGKIIAMHTEQRYQAKMSPKSGHMTVVYLALN